MTLTTVGYGDITATNVAEYAVLTTVMLIGGFMWAYIIGAVCGTVATMDPNKVKYQQRYDEARASSDARARARRSRSGGFSRARSAREARSRAFARR